MHPAWPPQNSIINILHIDTFDEESPEMTPALKPNSVNVKILLYATVAAMESSKQTLSVMLVTQQALCDAYKHWGC